ncbi:MAG: class I SAM-dependent methyltransferase [Proteobacteria bacterium]|nr:class I SAM-dependent methyltransferase [Pseudomonadota bacterium]
MEKEKYFDQLLNFYRICLDIKSPIADFTLIQDSQTRLAIEEIFAHSSCPNILDYGCGKLRLFNALLSKKGNSKWAYYGVDMEDPLTSHQDLRNDFSKFQKMKNRFETGSILNVREFTEKFDSIVFMNVLHELSIFDIATAIEDARQLLKKNGNLFFIDTVLLREGEPRFVPFYGWEIEELFTDYKNKSYVTKSGIPIMFFVIPQKGIPCFHNTPEKLYYFFNYKLNSWSLLSNSINESDSILARKKLGLGKSSVFDYGYINTIIANANYRLIEYKKYEIDPAQITKSLVRFISIIEKNYWDNNHIPSFEEIYIILKMEFNYSVIYSMLKYLESAHILFPFRESNAPISFSEVWDILVERIGIEKISDLGFSRSILEANTLHYNEYL